MENDQHLTMLAALLMRGIKRVMATEDWTDEMEGELSFRRLEGAEAEGEVFGEAMAIAAAAIAEEFAL